MCRLTVLSNVLCMNIVKEWLSIQEIGLIDSSLTNYASRSQYLDFFRITLLNELLEYVGDQRMIHWMSSRGICFKSLTLKLSHSINETWDWCQRLHSLHIQDVTQRNSGAYCLIIESCGKNLKELSISNGGQVVDNDWLMSRLRCSVCLESLRLISCRLVTEISLMQIPTTCTALHKLYLNHCPEVRSVFLSYLVSRLEVEAISIINCSLMTSCPLNSLYQHGATLVVCFLSGITFDESDFLQLGRCCPLLEELRVQYSSFVTRESNPSVLFQKIRCLELSFNHAINDYTVENILFLLNPNLTELNFSNTKLGGIKMQLRRFKELRTLSVSGCYLNNIDALFTLKDCAESLQYLDVSGTGGQFIAMLSICIGSCCPMLKVIDVSKTLVTTKGITNMLLTLSHLERMNAAKCHFVKDIAKLTRVANEHNPPVLIYWNFDIVTRKWKLL